MNPAMLAVFNDLVNEYKHTRRLDSRRVNAVEPMMPNGLWEIVRVRRGVEKVIRVNPNFSSAFCTWTTLVNTVIGNSRSYNNYILRLCTSRATMRTYNQHIESFYGE